jgi:thioredoxin reductase
VLLCDDRRQRNRASKEIHGLLGSNGRSPAQFLQDGREDLKSYEYVSVCQTRVMEIEACESGFRFKLDDGLSGVAAKVLLASGIVDEVPELPGIDELYGISVHHCLYCDGFEYAGKSVAAYGKGDKGAELGIMMKHWMGDIVVCSDGAEVSADVAKKLEQHGIPLRAEPVRALRGESGILSSIEFENGADRSCTGLFFSTGCHQGSDLPQRLGCRRDEKGGVITDALTEETTVPGVYVAGDVSRDVLLVAVAIAEGAKAAVAINKAFLKRDGFCD